MTDQFLQFITELSQNKTTFSLLPPPSTPSAAASGSLQALDFCGKEQMGGKKRGGKKWALLNVMPLIWVHVHINVRSVPSLEPATVQS